MRSSSRRCIATGWRGSSSLGTWDRLPDGSLFLQERETDWVDGDASDAPLLVTPDGERIERRFVHRGYTATEWVAMLGEAGFAEVECFSDWAGEKPPAPDRRLIVRARAGMG